MVKTVLQYGEQEGHTKTPAVASLIRPDHQTQIAQNEVTRTEPEYLFRRCNSEEAAATVSAQRLANGKRVLEACAIKRCSDPDKWVSEKPRFIVDYCPRGSDPAMYEKMLAIEVKPGTIAQLKEQKGKTVKRGPRGAFGLPPDIAEWFNSQIVSIADKSLQVKPKLLPLKPGFDILVDPKGNPCYFLAFPCNLLAFDKNTVYFGDDINLSRTTWLKTSLMWTAWHSGFATKPGMERLLQIALPPSYLDYLVAFAVSTRENLKTDEIVYQRDPDRTAIYERNPYGLLPFKFSKTSSTTHFGIMGDALLDFVADLSRGRITDITNQLQAFFFRCNLSGEELASALYRRLRLDKTTYEGNKHNANPDT